MRCFFEKLNGVNVVKCRRCGRLVKTKDNPEKVYAECRLICAHRSKEFVRKEVCPTCSGVVQIKIFTCIVHSECALTNKLSPKIKDCNSCTDFCVE